MTVRLDDAGMTFASLLASDGLPAAGAPANL
jgi:hypothetical protein